MLDRIEIEEVGPDPERVAEEIHKQLGYFEGAVELVDIAKSLDIVEIKMVPLANIEGALITTPSRSVGSILINKNSRPVRRCFTIAHELGHYLNPRHKEPNEGGFWCYKSDLFAYNLPMGANIDIFKKQEIEANYFASALLMPRNQIYGLLYDEPSLEEILYFAKLYEVSKEAMARRYVDLHSDSLAVFLVRMVWSDILLKETKCLLFA